MAAKARVAAAVAGGAPARRGRRGWWQRGRVMAVIAVEAAREGAAWAWMEVVTASGVVAARVTMGAAAVGAVAVRAVAVATARVAAAAGRAAAVEDAAARVAAMIHTVQYPVLSAGQVSYIL